MLFDSFDSDQRENSKPNVAGKTILSNRLVIWRTQPTRLSAVTKTRCASPLTTLLLGDTDGAATAAGGLGVLTTDTEAPVVAETTVGADLLEALKIVTELRVNTVGEDLRVLAVDNVALSVQEPARDLVLGRVLDDGDDTLELFGGELTGTVRENPLVIEALDRVDWRSCDGGAWANHHHHGPSLVICVPLVQVDIGLLADQVGVTTTDTLDLGEGVHHLLLAINVGVEETQDL